MVLVFDYNFLDCDIGGLENNGLESWVGSGYDFGYVDWFEKYVWELIVELNVEFECFGVFERLGVIVCDRDLV